MDDKFFEIIENFLNKEHIQFEYAVKKENEILTANIKKYTDIKSYNINCISIRTKFKKLKKLCEFLKKNKYLDNNCDVIDKKMLILYLNNSFYIIYEQSIDSHVLIPHFILKNFAKNGSMNYLNYQKNFIDKISNSVKLIYDAHAKSYNTKQGYYSQYIEEQFDKYETNISDLIIKLNKIKNCENNEKNLVTEKDYKNIKDFFGICMLRDGNIVNEIKEHSYTACIMSEISHENVIELALTNNLIDRLFADYKVCILFNNTKISFVLSNKMISEINYEEEMLIMAVSPEIAFLLIKSDKLNDNFIGIIDKEDGIDSINYNIAFKSKYNGNDIIGTKEVLEKIKEKIKL